MGTQTLDRIAARLNYPIRCISKETNQILDTELLLLAEEDKVQRDSESSEPNSTSVSVQHPTKNGTAQTLTADHQLGKDVTDNNDVDGQPSVVDTREFQTRLATNTSPGSKGRIAAHRQSLASIQQPISESAKVEHARLIDVDTSHPSAAMPHQQNHETAPALAELDGDFKGYSHVLANTAAVDGRLDDTLPAASPDHNVNYDEAVIPVSSSLSSHGSPATIERSPVHGTEILPQPVVQVVNNVPDGITRAESRMRISATKTMQLKPRSSATRDNPVEPINPSAEMGEMKWAGTALESDHQGKQPDSIKQQFPDSIAHAFEYARAMNQQQTNGSADAVSSRIENNFHLNLTVAEDAQTQNLEHMKEMFLKILLESARQQGLDV